MDDLIAGMDEARHSGTEDVAFAVHNVFEDSLDNIKNLERTVGMGHRFSSRPEHHLADFNIVHAEIAFIKQDAEYGAARSNIRVTGFGRLRQCG